jgi:hypothetical protein
MRDLVGASASAAGAESACCTGCSGGAVPQPQEWTRRFTAIGPRLSEAVELYQQLGFEVALAPAEADEAETTVTGSCVGCAVTSLARTIYTRPWARGSQPLGAASAVATTTTRGISQ